MEIKRINQKINVEKHFESFVCYPENRQLEPPNCDYNCRRNDDIKKINLNSIEIDD